MTEPIDTARLREEHIEPDGYPRRMKSRHELRVELNLAAAELDRLRAELAEARRERALIVAWMREVDWPYRNDALIAAIERGEHLKGQTDD